MNAPGLNLGSADTLLRESGGGSGYTPAMFSPQGSPFFQLGQWARNHVPWKTVGAPLRWAQGQLNHTPLRAGAGLAAGVGIPVAALSYFKNLWDGTDNPGMNALRTGGIAGTVAGLGGAGLSAIQHNRENADSWNESLRQKYNEFTKQQSTDTLKKKEDKSASSADYQGAPAFQQMIYDDPHLSTTQKQSLISLLAGLSPDQMEGLKRFLATAAGTTAGVAIASYFAGHLGIGSIAFGGLLGGATGYMLSGGMGIYGKSPDKNLFGVAY